MNWKHKINIAQILKEGGNLDDYDVVPKVIRVMLFNEISNLPRHLKDQWGVQSFLSAIDSDNLDVSTFNDLLNDFYDYCDQNSIWVQSV